MQISWDEAKPHKKWQNLYFVQAWLTNILTVQFLKQHCAKSVNESLYGVQNLKEEKKGQANRGMFSSEYQDKSGLK
jgi:hypothetical protein